MKPSFLKPILISVISATLICAALTAISALILSSLPDPSKFTSIVGTASVILGTLIAGRISASDVENRLLSAFLSGIFTALPLFLTTLILGDLGINVFIRIALCIICVMLGSLSKKTDTSARTSAKKRKAIAKKYSV